MGPYSHLVRSARRASFSLYEKRGTVRDSLCFVVDLGIFPGVGIKARGRAILHIGRGAASRMDRKRCARDPVL